MKKFAFCKVSLSPLRAENRDASEMVSQLLFGEPVEILEVNQKWTKILTFFDAYEAWVDSRHLLSISEKELKRWLDGLNQQKDLFLNISCEWGIQTIFRGSFLTANGTSIFNIGRYSFEIVGNQNNAFDDWQDFALSYLNAPYLWGGKSPFGIDCSGFSQQVFRFREITIPRDAYQQVELGQHVDFEDQQSGDLAFFSNEQGKITHVGVILENQKIIHSSSWVKIDELRPDGIYIPKTNEKTHVLSSIRRI